MENSQKHSLGSDTGPLTRQGKNGVGSKIYLEGLEVHSVYGVEGHNLMRSSSGIVCSQKG